MHGTNIALVYLHLSFQYAICGHNANVKPTNLEKISSCIMSEKKVVMYTTEFSLNLYLI